MNALPPEDPAGGSREEPDVPEADARPSCSRSWARR